ncbi:MAG: DNA polymerase III subunit chi, partial [Rickettsiales bacterium]|nr:DNA polymerase III subunit chi [Rickettsiales bacterium]
MATAVQFYQLLSTPLDRALPKLLEKALSAGFRAVLTAATPEQLEQLNTLLWTYDPASFLPHGSDADGEAETQPIFLSLGTQAPNGAKLLVVTDGKWPENAAEYERIADIFDGNDAAALEAARTRWAS